MEDIRTLPKNEEEDNPDNETQSNNNGYVLYQEFHTCPFLFC